MDSTRHIALVEQLQVELERHPLRYSVKLVLLSLAGFAAVLSPLMLATLCLGATVVRVRAQGLASLADGWALIVLALGLLALRALWLRIPPPIGHLLQREEAPRLRSMVEDLRVAAGAPRLAGIVITDELNAAVVSLPRVLGLPWSRHYLLLGLPLMQQLEADALRAVLAESGSLAERGSAGLDPGTASAESAVATRWKCASLEIAWRKLSSSVPDNSPPCRCATWMPR